MITSSLGRVLAPMAEARPAGPAEQPAAGLGTSPDLGYPYLAVCMPRACVCLRLAPCARVGTARRPRPRLNEAFRVANIKSQIKRNKQNEKARLRNKAVKSELKTSVRKFREAADAGNAEAAVAAMRAASAKLDKAASKGVIHKKQAANRKSAIARRAEQLAKSA
jgi:small subunit ribosomal protein S20